MKNFQDFTVSDYLRMLRRRIWYLIAATVLVSAGTAVYVWRLPDIYKSETTILVSTRLLPEDYIGSVVRESVPDRIEFVRQQIQSRTFLERIVQEFQLGGPAGNGTDEIVSAVSQSTEITVFPPNVFKLAYRAPDPNVAQSVARRLGERVMQLNDTFRKEKVFVADQFLDDQLRQAGNELVQTEGKLRTFEQQHFPGVPALALTPETLKQLQTELSTADASLESALDQRKAIERRLQEQRDFKVVIRSAALPSVEPSQAAPRPQKPARQPTQLEQKLASKRSELAAASAKYTPLHPDIARLTREVQDLQSEVAQSPVPSEELDVKEATPSKPTADDQMRNVVLPQIDSSIEFQQSELQLELEQVNREITRRQQVKSVVEGKNRSYFARLNPNAEVAQQLTSLTRDHEAAQQRYTFLSGKKLTSELGGSVDTSQNNVTFQVIDAANLPQKPISPDRLKLTLLGCLSGLGLGLGLMFVREYLDATLKDEVDAAAMLKLPLLTSIPMVAEGGDKNGVKKIRGKPVLTVVPPQGQPQEGMPIGFSLQSTDRRVRSVIMDPSTTAGEQYRLLRANLSLALTQRVLKSFLITSAIPNEGKTFTACCLAGILAQESGKKVLLIDGDLRTGKGREVLGLTDGHSSGLSKVLRGETDIEHCLIKCSDLNLYFLPSGDVVDNPAELLSSPALGRMMREVSQSFDWVVVDSPPSLGLADANLLAAVCDATVLVIRAERTPAPLVQDTIQRIGTQRIFGVLMNGVRTMKSTEYYRYYHRRERKLKTDQS